MPVRQISPSRSPEHVTLVEELLEEWTQDTGKPEPIILEELGAGNKVAHVYVVWSKWQDVDRPQRSEIIMDAAERKMSPPDLMNITIAMGLTPDEAKRLRIVP